MNAREQMDKLWANLAGLGGRRLAALGIVGATVLLAIGLGAFYLSKPEREILYSGLSREDVGQLGSVLKDNGIGFDVAPDGTSVLVGHADTARARMLLAEKGLPQSTHSGYELFNELGSFGLTSFMQDVTRVRALEGELARTIQTMDGIKAARVHIVLPDRASFRRDQQKASASVVIRTRLPDDATAANAIRHLVAASLPGMDTNNVTVLNTEGVVLVSGDDPSASGGGLMDDLKRRVDRELEEKIRRTLTPYLGYDNFQISVSTRLNTDRKQVSEVIYDPESRVERSVRVVKETGTSQNSTTDSAATVQQNIPVAQMEAGGGNSSNEENERREELTNFEISSKKVDTVHDGYEVENLSIAVLVNQARLQADEGQPDVMPIETRLMEIEQLVQSATGFDKERGDQLKVSSVMFADGGNDLEPVPGPSMGEVLMRQSGTLINAGTILVMAILLIWFGLRPTLKTVLGRSQQLEAGAVAIEGEMAAGMLPGPDEADMADGHVAGLAPPEQVNLIEDLTSKKNRTPQKRLEQIIDFDEEQAATILRQWMRVEGA
ncbi:flagellar basal-body MS-ring/collar protein FliF [Afifella marina]|uniref:Flagellar M-ring protein n=1 Tax=Afifella marina DSM 2698 TaxID=1120955 RepID=A0A1G5MVB6_AFIMA|nr:flagellar basal-body MS-ring/collar protein FliF [Afifella marina]MBK1622046.1 flagellar M-ring protein FliF [Afifella marina DSM 2698]MBK1627839.1 flagellar M-ring protein FliF [Afifella marina]MBK5916806.1 flagellar M-ring protein FliF [Afifella marina]RAI19869.1 flagellar M-ring protein FliF [Afifella marina DSM 2698]SCZ29022.1 flagellar M-ring protein FliF [Afifella marina DSM 2698]